MLEISQKIIKKTNVGPRDTLHLASAEEGSCKYFVTCDDRLIKMVKTKSREIGLKVKLINPVDLIRKEATKIADS